MNTRVLVYEFWRQEKLDFVSLTKTDYLIYSESR